MITYMKYTDNMRQFEKMLDVLSCRKPSLWEKIDPNIFIFIFCVCLSLCFELLFGICLLFFRFCALFVRVLKECPSPFLIAVGMTNFFNLIAVFSRISILQCKSYWKLNFKFSRHNAHSKIAYMLVRLMNSSISIGMKERERKKKRGM